MLQLVFEEPGLPADGLPDDLRERYGGDLGFEGRAVFANFVSSLDGVVAIPDVPGSNKLIAAGSEADRFVMALLRALADCVLIGSGTMHGSPTSTWTAERAYPPAAASLAGLRHAAGRPERPEVAILTASGALDTGHPVLEAGALVVTTGRGAGALEGRLPAASELAVVPGEDVVDVASAVQLLRERGHERILSEAGPRAMHSLLAAGLVDELFLTVSPLLVGRAPGQERLGLAEAGGIALDPPVAGRLVSTRRDGDHLFLRYMLRA